MSAIGDSSNRVAAALAPLRARWQALGKRERLAMTALAWLVGLALLWTIALRPAWQTVRAAPAKLDQLDAQLQQMQRMAGEARGLRGAPAVSSVQAQAALKAACDALGGAARLTLIGDRATIAFTNVSSTQLRDWLNEVRSAARARPVEANLTRNAQGYSGSVVVALPGGSA